MIKLFLRHNPEAIGISLDANGWVSITELIDNSTDVHLTEELIKHGVDASEKQRFAINHETGKIRANQGYTIDIDLNLIPQTPPDELIHGTTERFYNSIKQEGLAKQQRHHVHLSESASTAKAVGSRYGKPLPLKIEAKKMNESGYLFYKTDNNVWSVDHVPVQYIFCEALNPAFPSGLGI